MRTVPLAQLPLAIGGPDADIPVGGESGDRTAAYIGSDQGDLFVQPAESGPAVLCNGDPLSASRWLHDGDRIEIRDTRITVHRREDAIHLTIEHRAPTRARPELKPPPRTADPGPRAEDRVMIAAAEFVPTRLGHSGGALRLRPARVVTGIVLALLAGVSWFTFTARSLELRVTPTPDTLAIEGTWLQLELGGTHRIRPGSYTVVAEKDGFRRLEAPLEVTDQTYQVVELALEPKPGELTITTTPRQGVLVKVNGAVVGTTPIDPIELTPGEHLVEVSAERYRGDSATVDIEGAATEAAIEFTLQPLWAPVTFGSQPSGATVLVDGRDAGRTPMTADLLEGPHEVELRLAGHKPHRLRLTVAAGEPATIRSPALQPVDGWLVVETEPEGASINIDGQYQGVAPLELELAPGVDHLVTASIGGHQTREETIRIVSGETRELRLELEAEYGEIEIVVAPADAELVLNGESRGAASGILRLPAVPHRVEVRKPGFVPVRRRITPRPGYPQRLEIRLESEEEAREASRPPSIETSQGQELRLVGPGRFRMGASRREPGRRANETLRDVEITRPFYLATEEVSNAEFREFRASHRAGQIGGASLDLDDYPVVEVTWEDAARYCNWLSARESLQPAYVEAGGTLVAARPMTDGYRLPTEAEWAWAARYEGGGGGKKYSWGDSLPLPPTAGNYADGSARPILPEVIAGHQDGYAATAPVGSFEANALGIFNLGGNVAEWVHDPYSIYSSSSEGVDRDPMGPESGGYHVIKGGGWMDSKITELRLSYRDYGNEARPDVGFRIARYAD